MPNPILADQLFAKWREACGLPENCRRIVLDLQYREVVKVFYECLGDERLLDIEPPTDAVCISATELEE